MVDLTDEYDYVINAWYTLIDQKKVKGFKLLTHWFTPPLSVAIVSNSFEPMLFGKSISINYYLQTCYSQVSLPKKNSEFFRRTTYRKNISSMQSVSEIYDSFYGYIVNLLGVSACETHICMIWIIMKKYKVWSIYIQ